MKGLQIKNLNFKLNWTTISSQIKWNHRNLDRLRVRHHFFRVNGRENWGFWGIDMSQGIEHKLLKKNRTTLKHVWTNSLIKCNKSELEKNV